MVVRSRRSFSLIELLVVIALIACCMGTFALRTPYFFSGFYFKKSVERVHRSLELAHRHAYHFQIPLVVTLDQQQGGVTLRMRPLTSPGERWERYFKHSFFLKGIERIALQGKPPAQQVTLYFGNTLGDHTTGTLLLQSREGQESVAIGYTKEEDESAPPRFPAQIL